MRISPQGAVAFLVSVIGALVSFQTSIPDMDSYKHVELHQSTYDHRSVKTGHPVRSAIHKH
jgi:hypothetical protein